MSVSAYQIVTYANEPFRGNPAFVVDAGTRRSPGPVRREICAQLHQDVLAVLFPDGAEIDAPLRDADRLASRRRPRDARGGLGGAQPDFRPGARSSPCASRTAAYAASGGRTAI